MLRINIRQLYGGCVQIRTFSVSRSLFAKNEHVEGPSEQIQTAGADMKKETIDDVLRRSSKPVGAFQIGRASVAHRLLMREVDEEVLVFPEVVDKSVLDKISEVNSSKATFFSQHLSIVERNSPVFNSLKKFDAFKHNIQTEYGGLAYSATEMALASEPEGNNVAVALALSAHRNVCSAISDFGSISQKEKYLPLLATGEMIGTTCMHDKDGFNSITESNEVSEEYILNGSKVFVVNPVNSQLFLVFARTRTNDMVSDANESLSAFLLEANTPGVTISRRDETIGNQHIYQSTVTFNDVRVKSENWISIPGNGQSVIRKQITEKRLQHGLLNIAQMRNLLEYSAQYCREINSHVTSENIGKAASNEVASLRDVIARAANAIYASESALYLTTGIADLYEDADISTEAAIVKIYTQERLVDMMSQLCGFLDANVTIKGHPMERKIRDVIQLQAYDDPKELLKLYIGVSGIQYCGIRMFEDIKKKRNPLLNPEYIMKNLLRQLRYNDKIPFEQNIEKKLHTSLDSPMKLFEESLRQLNVGVEILMTDYARNSPQMQCKISRLADATILSYVSLATLSRASRALYHEFESGTAEHDIAEMVCEEHSATISHLMNKISDDSFDALDQKVSKMLIKNKKYFAAHPLTRFF